MSKTTIGNPYIEYSSYEEAVVAAYEVATTMGKQGEFFDRHNGSKRPARDYAVAVTKGNRVSMYCPSTIGFSLNGVYVEDGVVYLSTWSNGPTVANCETIKETVNKFNANIRACKYNDLAQIKDVIKQDGSIISFYVGSQSEVTA